MNRAKISPVVDNFARIEVLIQYDGLHRLHNEAMKFD